MAGISIINKNRNQVIVSNCDLKFQIRKKAVGQLTLHILNHLRFKNTRLSIIFGTDFQIKKLNQRFLNHAWTTDVIAFPFLGVPLNQKKSIFLGDVFISPKRALIQAPLFQASFKEELARYICHGILHLAGYKDKTMKEKRAIRQQENKLLALYKNNIKRII